MAEDSPNRPGTIEAREILRGAIPRAAEVLIKLLDAKDEKLRLRASESILTLAGIVHNSGHSYSALDPARDKWEREALDREWATAKNKQGESSGVGDLPCPKCNESVHPCGGAEGTCPHCAVDLRLVLMPATAQAEI